MFADVEPPPTPHTMMSGGGRRTGLLYRSTWHLHSDLSLQYVVLCDPPRSPHPADVFVSLEEAVSLLTSVPGDSVRPPNIQTVWTINTAGTHLDLWPLSEFVYEAALKAEGNGKKFRQVYDGILTEIVRNLYSPNLVTEDSTDLLCPYTEIDGGLVSSPSKTEEDTDWTDCEVKTEPVTHPAHHPTKRKKRKRKSEAEEKEEEKEECDMENSTTCDKTRKVKAERRHQCTTPGCDQTFPRLSLLTQHCRRDHPDSPELRPLARLARLEPLETLHERAPVREEAGAEEMFVCGLRLCSLRFSRYLSLVGHERTHVDAYICILCGECCHSAENLISHSDQLHPTKSEFICRVCGFFNRKSEQLATHVQQEHLAGSVLYQCSQCQFVTEKKQSLHAHKRTAHSQQEFYCEICGKNYASAASLYVHQRSHQPDFKKFQCKLCPRTFAYSSGLSYHMAVHTGEKPFSCPQCSNNFGSHTALSRHVKVVHAEEKDMVYQCQHCGKKFPRRKGREFQDHVKIHTGERDHVCSICGSGYFSRKMLRKHELKKHQALLPRKPLPVRVAPESVPQLQVQHNSSPLSLEAAQAAGVPLQNIPRKNSLNSPG